MQMLPKEPMRFYKRYTPQFGVFTSADPQVAPSGVVISDIRFENEIGAVADAGGRVVRMLRGRGLDGAAGQHLSETEMQGISDECFDRLIDNRDWTLDQLEERMRELVVQIPGIREPLWSTP